MDWDGVGTFAMFIASGAVGVGIIMLKAYRAKLAHKLEMARIASAESHDAEDALEQVQLLEEKVRQLTERADFTEKLLDGGERAADPQATPES